MHEQTKRELIESGTGLVSSLLKEMMVHRNQIEVLEQQKEKEVELAKARAEAGQTESTDHGHTTQGVRDPAPEPALDRTQGPTSATPAQIEEALDELIDEEMCSVCRELLVALKEKPPKTQVRGIMEYGTFKKNLDDGAGVDELKSVIRETDVLHDIFQEKYTGSGAQA